MVDRTEVTLSDPSALTTNQLQREISSLKELMQSELAAVEKAVAVAHEDLVRVPTEVQKAIGSLRELHDARFHAIDEKIATIHERLAGKRASITALCIDTAKLHTRADESALRHKERLDVLSVRLDEVIDQAAVNRTDVARLTSEAIAGREATLAMYKSQQDAIVKADVATEKRFASVNEFRAQLGDQARTFMPRAEVEVMLKAFDSRLDKIEGLLTERAGQKYGTKEGWLYAVGVIGLIGTILGLLAMFKR